MKKSDNPRNNSRRSFIKKSVVVSMAASNLTMFSGLVDASNTNPSSSSLTGNCGGVYASNVTGCVATYTSGPDKEKTCYATCRNEKVVSCIIR